MFLVLIVIDAAIGAANPLVYAGDHRPRDPARRLAVVVELALLLAVLAVFDAVLSLVERWISARIGEGLIFDMRTQVFAHFQRMPVAFFTRTQTGALVSRLNNDVLDAQSAFTNTLSSVVGNAITWSVTLLAMFFLSWQITLLALVLLPLFVLPARWVGTPDPGHHARELQPERGDDLDDDRAVQRRRARCWWSCSASRSGRSQSFEAKAGPGARHRRHAGDVHRRSS